MQVQGLRFTPACQSVVLGTAHTQAHTHTELSYMCAEHPHERNVYKRNTCGIHYSSLHSGICGRCVASLASSNTENNAQNGVCVCVRVCARAFPSLPNHLAPTREREKRERENLCCVQAHARSDLRPCANTSSAGRARLMRSSLIVSLSTVPPPTPLTLAYTHARGRSLIHAYF